MPYVAEYGLLATGTDDELEEHFTRALDYAKNPLSGSLISHVRIVPFQRPQRYAYLAVKIQNSEINFQSFEKLEFS